MPVKIRLMRIGAKKRPFYRIVAVDERKKRTGEYIELLGTYNPLTEPKDIILKQDRIDEWLKNGAQPSTGFLRIIGKAPQRLPRKPKKAQPEKPAEAPKVEATEEVTEDAPAEEVQTSEEVVETPTDTVSEAQVETPTEENPTSEDKAPEPETTEETPAEVEEEKKEESSEEK